MKRLLLAVTILLAASQGWAAGGKGYVGTTAPATCAVGNFWIDTDGAANDRFYTCTATNTWTKNSGSYTLPTAAADTLGGVKVGDRLSIADGVLSADVQTPDISGKEDSLGNPSTNGYVLSSTTAGVRSWIEMTGGGTGIAHAPSDGNYYASKDGAWATLAGVFQPADADLTSAAGGSAAGNSKLFGTNSSGVVGWYDIPGEGSGIAHATADGKWYGSKDGAWIDLAPTFSSALPKWIDMPVGHSFAAGDLAWYNGQVWKASGTHSKVLGEYPDAESTDWEDYVSAPVVVDYPTVVGVPSWTTEGWAGTSYTVGTAAGNLVALDGSGDLALNTVDATFASVTVTRTASPSAIELYEGTGEPGDNKLTLTLSGGLAADATLNADQILVDGDIGSTVQAYDADLTTAAGAGAAGASKYFGTNASSVVGFYDLPSGGAPTTIASGTVELNTTTVTSSGVIASEACQALASAQTATGALAASDGVDWYFIGDPTTKTGFIPLATGMLTLIPYVSANDAVQVKVCNNTAASITLNTSGNGATIKWAVRR